MRPRSLLTAVIATAATVLPVVPALASPGGWVDVDDDGSGVELGATDRRSSSGDRGGGGVSDCSWSRVPDHEIDLVWWSAGSEVGPGISDEDGGVANPSDFEWYWMSCPDGAGGQTADLIPTRRGESPVDPIVLRDEAIDRLSLPVPTIAMNPAGDQVVHVASWLWIEDADWGTRSKSVSAGDVTTTVTASPRRVLWDLGNGDTVTCDGPGTPYDPSIPSAEQATDCSYTYTHTSAGQPDDAYQATATIEWAVSWTVSGASGGGSLPALFTTSTLPVRVSEMQALNQ